MGKIEIVLFKKEEDYRSLYVSELANQAVFMGDIPILFDLKSFDHIFFEPGKEDGQYVFSKRRAKRMLFIKPILSGEVEREIMFELETGNYAIFCFDLECVIYLRVRPKANGLQIGTFIDFGKGHTKMYNKQKKKCVPITLQEIKQKL